MSLKNLLLRKKMTKKEFRNILIKFNNDCVRNMGGYTENQHKSFTQRFSAISYLQNWNYDKKNNRVILTHPLGTWSGVYNRYFWDLSHNKYKDGAPTFIELTGVSEIWLPQLHIKHVNDLKFFKGVTFYIWDDGVYNYRGNNSICYIYCNDMLLKNPELLSNINLKFNINDITKFKSYYKRMRELYINIYTESVYSVYPLIENLKNIVKDCKYISINFEKINIYKQYGINYYKPIFKKFNEIYSPNIKIFNLMHYGMRIQLPSNKYKIYLTYLDNFDYYTPDEILEFIDYRYILPINSKFFNIYSKYEDYHETVIKNVYEYMLCYYTLIIDRLEYELEDDYYISDSTISHISDILHQYDEFNLKHNPKKVQDHVTECILGRLYEIAYKYDKSILVKPQLHNELKEYMGF